MRYHYNPLGIAELGKDKMRFELGDTLVEMGEQSSALCDEEYEQMLLGVTAETWEAVKLEILSAILHKLSFQVDTKVDTLSYDFSARLAVWERMYLQLKKEIEEEIAENARCHGTPSMSFGGKCHFFDGIHDNRRGF